MSNATANYNTDESVKVVFNSLINSREMVDMISKVATGMVDNGDDLPEVFEDVLKIEIITRPSGSKYAVVDFA